MDNFLSKKLYVIIFEEKNCKTQNMTKQSIKFACHQQHLYSNYFNQITKLIR